MKKMILLAAAAVMAAVSANAQDFNKSDWYFGAQSTGLVLQHRFIDGNSATDFDLNAVGGWFFADKFAADAMLGFDYAKWQGYDADHALNFGAGVRYYPFGNLFARLGYNGQAANGREVVSYLDAKVGYDLFLSEKVFFEPAVYYEKNLAKGGENILGLSFGIGVKF